MCSEGAAQLGLGHVASLSSLGFRGFWDDGDVWRSKGRDEDELGFLGGFWDLGEGRGGMRTREEDSPQDILLGFQLSHSEGTLIPSGST